MYLPLQQLTPPGALIYVLTAVTRPPHTCNPSVMFLQNNKCNDASRVLRLLGRDLEQRFILT
jgi:hypothetical protein